MAEHVGALGHQRKAKEHKIRALWGECTLQTYFTARNKVDYFIVTESADEKGGALSAVTLAERVRVRPPDEALFSMLREDADTAAYDLEEKAGIVQDFENSRSERIPWLGRTGFPAHLRGLRDEEIKSSYALPPKRVLDNYSHAMKEAGGDGSLDDTDEDPSLVRMIVAAEAMLRDAYELCSDTSPERKMTQMRANILNEFYSGASGKADGFRYFKNESTLTKYFKRMKQLLAYYYRVVYCDGGHFTREREGQAVPADIIKPSSAQQQAMDGIIEVLHHQDRRQLCGREAELALKHAVRRLYMALICHTVGSVPFRSAVLSFCAMISRKAYTDKERGVGGGKRACKGGRGEAKKEDGKGQGRGQEPMTKGIWYGPGNYNSNLSALTWAAQLVLFDYACFDKQEDENRIPDLLSEVCQKFLQQNRETPFGHILQWRLYLFAVSKKEVAGKQARWSLDGQTITYDGRQLHMDQVSQLVASEYRQAYSLLHDELLLGATEIPPIESWKIQDDLDRDEFGASWLTDIRNADLLEGAPLALLQRIQNSATHRSMFLRDGPGGCRVICPKAMALYEVHAQEFLGRMSNLVYVPPGPPFRTSEQTSVSYSNTARRRHVFVWEQLVMIYVQYHKGQEQSGSYKENIRFLPRAIGDLLLTYLAYVLPLRQIFLRQQTAGALLSPYIWSELDGQVWKDRKVSSCLSKACARAEVPRFQVAWWRQVAASITQEKFSARERANFNMVVDTTGSDDIEDEAELAALAGMSNHTAQTMHHAYAGTTTLTMTVLLHRAHRASVSWQSLFRVDQVLRGKRPLAKGGGDEPASSQLLMACKKARFRKRAAHTEGKLLAVARRLYNDPSLRFRAPGQRNGILATLSSRTSEQVVVILATGSGKTLIIMVGAALSDAATTILILPTVALRGDMLTRLRTAGIRYHTWSPGSSRTAPLVLVSAEAACTPGFLEYAHALVGQQRLDRIVVDECHLTVTASSYRESMAHLGWYVRQVRTQTLWLTATLPPVMQDAFNEQNKLVRPDVVRESTNRPNIRYVVQVDRGTRNSLVDRAASLVTSCWGRGDLFKSKLDKIIIFCPTKALVAELADLLGCPSYVGGNDMTEEEKLAALAQWRGATNPPAIVATSALGPGFDYPYVRWVIHVDAPELMTSFSQESGRAGRDGEPAESLVLLRATWQPQTGGNLNVDEEAMQLYLTQKHCARGVLSQFLDERHDWRWCMESEEVCGVCREPHSHSRPDGLEYRLPLPQGGGGHNQHHVLEASFTGPAEVLRQDRVYDEELSRYMRDLDIMSGCCLYCRVEGRLFDHAATACSRRWDWIDAKKGALKTCKANGRLWMARLVVCWKCYQPQEICRVADPEVEDETSCRFPDMVIPLCYGKHLQPDCAEWFQRHFKRDFKTNAEYMLWLGGKATFGGIKCVQAICVAALVLAELG